MIIGQMAAGKSTVGRLVARAIGWPFRDNDAALEQRVHMSAAAARARLGNDALHTLEHEIFTDLVRSPEPTVIAAPASVVLTPWPDDVRALAFVVWLQAAAAVLATRAGASRHRPVPDHVGAAFFDPLVAQRDALYAAAANLHIETDQVSPDAAAERIVAAMRQWRDGPPPS